NRTVLILCERPPGISVGREGSREHIRCGPTELAARRWPVRWVNRGGGCFLHLPRQLAIYPFIALDRIGLGLQAYVEHLHGLVAAALGDFDVRAAPVPGGPGVWVGGRGITHVGIALNDWVAYFGATPNVTPDMELPRRETDSPNGELPMTSLE